MHTISMLRRTLGLSSDNQVRNRIERIKDLLSEHIRRGPNNQIFLTDPGLDLMKQLQELYDTGLTMAEASNVLRATSYQMATSASSVSYGSPSNEAKPNQRTADAPSRQQDDDLAWIRKHVETLERQLASSVSQDGVSSDAQPWWAYLREDLDVT